jgi:hypothetical protein
LARFEQRSSEPGVSLPDALCATCVDVLEVDGAGLAVGGVTGTLTGIGTSPGVMAALEEIERTLGEGPCVDAYNTGEAIAEPDLENTVPARWVGFTEPALQAGARAVFGYPLRIGSSRLGALNLCAVEPGLLTMNQHQDALTLADVATRTILLVDPPSPDGRSGDVDIGANQIEIHQATGMISVQLRVPVSHALARLRAHAFAEGLPISLVAAQVVQRHLRFEPEGS